MFVICNCTRKGSSVFLLKTLMWLILGSEAPDFADFTAKVSGQLTRNTTDAFVF